MPKKIKKTKQPLSVFPSKSAVFGKKTVASIIEPYS